MKFAEALRVGTDKDVFCDVDNERTADRLYTIMLSGLFRRTTTDDIDLEVIWDDAYSFID